MKVLAYVSGIVMDKKGFGGFDVSYGTTDADYSSNGTFYVDLSKGKVSVEDELRTLIADAINEALGSKIVFSDVELF